MVFWTTICLLFTLAYAVLMAVYFHGWRKLESFIFPQNFSPKTKITVVVPARNESQNIVACLKSILENDYPPDLFEIIVVDDFSDDGTAEKTSQIAENQKVSLRILRLADFVFPTENTISFKKKAIEIAIREASGEVILTTDADCEVPKNWLHGMAFAFEKNENVQMVAAPVLFFREQNFIEKFQTLDFAGMMGVTGAGIRLGFQRMGNGANLAYRRSAFFAAEGFSGNENRASGDDIFLMQKIAAANPQGILFLKNREMTVQTRAQPNIQSFVNQRIRWGSKNAAYSEKWVTAAVASVFFFCWTIIFNLILVFIFPEKIAPVLAVQIFVKLLADWFLLSEMCRFFNRRELLKIFLPSFWLHIFYIAVVGAASIFFKKYEWKGRRVS